MPTITIGGRYDTWCLGRYVQYLTPHITLEQRLPGSQAFFCLVPCPAQSPIQPNPFPSRPGPPAANPVPAEMGMKGTRAFAGQEGCPFGFHDVSPFHSDVLFGTAYQLLFSPPRPSEQEDGMSRWRRKAAANTTSPTHHTRLMLSYVHTVLISQIRWSRRLLAEPNLDRVPQCATRAISRWPTSAPRRTRSPRAAS